MSNIIHFCGFLLISTLQLFLRRKNFEKTEEYKKGFGNREDGRNRNPGTSNGGAVAGGSSEPSKGGYIQR